ncbi:MAG: cytochrome c [Flavobacterium sp.]|uniref:cytochrome c n=1 Tax=Flavobacterium sp. TaxID=239 RepID=UPI001B1B6850|nr:cytochrome c [Flavobacterium sp.]MBO9584877.1 cytochrome c [Flavobacterium sp.]
MKKLRPIFTGLVAALATMACSSGDDNSTSPPPTSPPTGGGSTVTNPTYTANIKSIIDANCTSCHGPGGSKSDVPFTTYAQVSANASNIKVRIEKPAGDPLKMPKGGSLSQANIDLINKWITDGMPN